MISVEEIRAHLRDLRQRRVRLIGHRAMLARLLDEIDALQAALSAKGERSDGLADVVYWASVAAREAVEPTKSRIDVKVSALLPGALYELSKALTAQRRRDG